MPIIEDSIHIHAAPAELFALSQDYALRRFWDPFVRELRYLDGATEAAVGAHVWVRAWTGLTMVVRYTCYRPPHAAAMTMVRGPWFFRRFAGTWLFKPHPDGGTRVTFRYWFKTRGRLLDPVIRWVFRRDIRARLRGLKGGAERQGLLGRLGQSCR